MNIYGGIMKIFEFLIIILISISVIMLNNTLANDHNGPGCSIDLNIETHLYDQGITTKDIETKVYAKKDQIIWLAVVAQNVSNLDSYQFDLLYDPEELSYVGSMEENQMEFEIMNILKKNDGVTIGFQCYLIEPGKINIANTMTGDDEQKAPEGSGVLAIIGFKTITNYPNARLKLANVLFIDTGNNQVVVQHLSHAGIGYDMDLNRDKYTLADLIYLLRVLSNY
jgi:hypothetical protein